MRFLEEYYFWKKTVMNINYNLNKLMINADNLTELYTTNVNNVNKVIKVYLSVTGILFGASGVLILVEKFKHPRIEQQIKNVYNEIIELIKLLKN